MTSYRRTSTEYLPRYPAVWTSLILMLFASTAARGGSIFDDDWVPPASAKPDNSKPAVPTPANPEPPTNPAPEVAPTNPVPAPPNSSPSATPRLAVPAALDLAQSRKLMKEAYATELNDRAVSSRREFSKKLLTDAAKYSANPADKFVVLGGAITAGQEGGDLPACFAAADELATSFRADALSVKAAAALKMSAKAYSSDVLGNVMAALEVVDRLASAEDFATATRLCSVVQSSASADAALNRVVQQRRRDIDAMRSAREKLTPQFDTLKSTPNDPAANLAVGSYYCFVIEQWDRGLPMLDKGSNSSLKGLAQLELAKPSSGDAIASLADQWWEMAAKEKGMSRAHVIRHAAFLYGQARDGISGLKQAVIEKRIASIDAGQVWPGAVGAVGFDWKSEGQLSQWEVVAGSGAPNITKDGILLTGTEKLELRRAVRASTITIEFTSTGCQAFAFFYGDVEYRLHYLNHYLGVASTKGDVEAGLNQAKTGWSGQIGKRYVAKISISGSGSVIKVGDAASKIETSNGSAAGAKFSIYTDQPNLVIHSVRFEP